MPEFYIELQLLLLGLPPCYAVGGLLNRPFHHADQPPRHPVLEHEVGGT